MFKCSFCEQHLLFFFSRYRTTLKKWRVFECMPIFKVLLAVGVDFISIYRSWERCASIRFSLLGTVLVKYWECCDNELSSIWAIFMCLPDCYFIVVSYGQALLLSMSY
jgi:hypothetical protein